MASGQGVNATSFRINVPAGYRFCSSVSLPAVIHRRVKFQNNKLVRQAKYSDQPGDTTSDQCLHSAPKSVAYVL